MSKLRLVVLWVAASLVLVPSSWAATPTIHEIQAATHISPYNGLSVSDVQGIVTARRSNGFYMQAHTPDADEATSEAIFVVTSSAPTVSVGDLVSVTGTVTEFRPGGSSGTSNLTTTELTSPTTTTLSSANPTPTPVPIGAGGRIPPDTVIEDDAAGDVETSGVFDPASDGIDFYESFEGMRVQVNNPVVVGPTNAFGEIPVLGDDGSLAGVRTTRGGIVIRPSDFNPERIILDDTLVAPSVSPAVDVGDHFAAPVVGVLDYSVGNFKLLFTSLPVAVPAGLAPESTTAPSPSQVAIATFNVENLDPADGAAKFDALAMQIVNNLKSPDIVALQEVQDNNGPTNDTTTDASVTFNTLIAAITAAGGPPYAFRQIDPVDDQDGGEPGGNIRVGFIFRTDRGLSFVDKPGAGSTAPNSVLTGGGLQFSPGRIDPTNAAFNASRKPLAAEFLFDGTRLYVIANHFNSKGGDHPLFGRFQPPILSTEAQRNQQAQIVNDFVDAILTQEPNAHVAVVGELNDYEFSTPLVTLKGGVLTDMVETIPQGERYTYVFDGNSQALDHILVTNPIAVRSPDYDIVHANAEFATQISDHDPQVLRYDPKASPPTSVAVRSFTAVRSSRSVFLRWRLAAGARVLGFNVYRGALRLNRALLPSGRRTFLDRLAPLRRAVYRLEVVRLDDSRAWHRAATARR